MRIASQLLLDRDCFLRWLRVAARGGEGPIRSPSGQELCVAFTSVGEAWYAALDLEYGAGKQRRLRHAVSRFAVMPVDDRVAVEWAQVRMRARGLGHSLAVGPDNDAWLAATAVVSGIPIATDRPHVYEGLPGLSVVDCPDA